VPFAAVIHWLVPPEGHKNRQSPPIHNEVAPTLEAVIIPFLIWAVALVFRGAEALPEGGEVDGPVQASTTAAEPIPSVMTKA